MKFSKKVKKPALTWEQAILRLAADYPRRLGQSMTIIVGQYDNYNRFNLDCKKAIEDKDGFLYRDKAFLRENALDLALNEIKRVTDAIYRLYGTKIFLGCTDTIEDKIDAIADFCELFYESGCREVCNFR